MRFSLAASTSGGLSCTNRCLDEYSPAQASEAMQLETLPEKKATEVGSYFVTNYPPFSVWSPEHKPTNLDVLDRAPRPNTPLGLYLHIPFCRKRCKFCYFRVYTDKNAKVFVVFFVVLLLVVCL